MDGDEFALNQSISASCDVRYDHIRFAAEALKLRDKVRVGSTDVSGDWRVFWVKLEILFTFRGGYPNI